MEEEALSEVSMECEGIQGVDTGWTDAFTNITFDKNLFSSFYIYSDECFDVCVLLDPGMNIMLTTNFAPLN